MRELAPSGVPNGSNHSQQQTQQQVQRNAHAAAAGGHAYNGTTAAPPPNLSHLGHLSPGQLQEMAQRQQRQIDAQQQMLVAKEQRLKFLRQQDYNKQHQMSSEYDRLRRLREKVRQISRVH